MTMLFEQAMADPLFRTNMPLPEAGAEGRRKWLKAFGGRLRDIAQSDALADNLEAFRQTFRYYRGGFDLPADALERKSGDRFAVIVRSLAVVDTDGKFALQSAKAAVPIPRELAEPLSWIVARGNFSLAELAAEYPQLADNVRDKLISSLAAMKAIAPV